VAAQIVPIAQQGTLEGRGLKEAEGDAVGEAVTEGQSGCPFKHRAGSTQHGRLDGVGVVQFLPVVPPQYVVPF
jgi:hypothetical protein